MLVAMIKHRTDLDMAEANLSTLSLIKFPSERCTCNIEKYLLFAPSSLST